MFNGERVRLVCAGKSIGVHSVVSTSNSPVHITKCPVYITSVICRFKVASSASLLPALQTKLPLTRGRCVLRGHHFLRCFSHPSLQTLRRATARRLSSSVSVLHVEVVNILHFRVIFDLVHAQVEHSHKNHRQAHLQEDPPTAICRGRIHSLCASCSLCARCLAVLSRKRPPS